MLNQAMAIKAEIDKMMAEGYPAIGNIDFNTPLTVLEDMAQPTLFNFFQKVLSTGSYEMDDAKAKIIFDIIQGQYIDDTIAAMHLS